jgi:hypothetical protein
MHAPLKWRDPSDIVHDVEEWVTWSFSVIDRELQEDADEDDQQSMGQTSLETSCGIRVIPDETFVSKGVQVTCLRCLTTAKP